MTYLSYSERVAFAERNFCFGKTDGKMVPAIRGKRQKIFICFEKKRLQIGCFYSEGKSVTVCSGQCQKLLQHG